MPNTTVVYTARRRLKSGVTDGDQITFSFDLESFDRTPTKDIKVSRSIDGTEQSVTNYIIDSYSCRTLPILPAERPDMDQFLYSVMDGETFTMTNLDESDRIMSCKLMGRDHSRTRETGAILDYFVYSFSVKEFS